LGRSATEKKKFLPSAAYLNDVVGSSECTESRRRATSEQETINDTDGMVLP